jgi:hypothetical protein
MTPDPTISIDHILYVARDLDVAAALMRERWGLYAVAGGCHPAWGTGNRLVPIGDHYIELFGVTDIDVASGNPVGRWLIAASEHCDGPRAVCLRSTDFDAQAARLGFNIENGERIYADGHRVVWRQAGVSEAMLSGTPFFFFDWPGESEALRLGQRPPRHAVEMAGIASVRLSGPSGRLPDLGPAIEIGQAADMRLDHVVVARADGSTFRIEGLAR